MRKRGVLLINLGTPRALNKPSVRAYLREFLSDPRVIDLPAMLRIVLLYCIILPFRPKKTLAAYSAVWREDGSPLMVLSQQFSRKMAALLGSDYQVELAMRYGALSIPEALDRLSHCTELTIVPLFPQYASATTGSVLEKVYTYLARKTHVMPIRVLPDLYAHPAFIKAYGDLAQYTLNKVQYDHVLFSFHGLPVRHITQAGCGYMSASCVTCPAIDAKNKNCYRAQCFASAHLIAKHLTLRDTEYSVAFQSRLGKTPWIEPYTDLMLDKLYASGVRNLAVICPSFVTDCLETLEEIGIGLKAQWMGIGGESFTLVPCLNDSDAWVEGLSTLIANH